MNSKEKQEIRKSQVRVRVTYIAAAFLFGGGGIFIILLICFGKVEEALDLFLTLLPVSAAVISFWFAGRGGSVASAQQNEENTKNLKPTLKSGPVASAQQNGENTKSDNQQGESKDQPE